MADTLERRDVAPAYYSVKSKSKTGIAMPASRRCPRYSMNILFDTHFDTLL